MFCRSGLGPIPAPDNPHKLIASYAKDMEIVVFNGHNHTTEIYDVDGVKYLMLGGGGAEQNPILPGQTTIKVPADYPPDLYWKSEPPKEDYNYVLVDVQPDQKTKFTLNRFRPWSAEPFGTEALFIRPAVPMLSADGNDLCNASRLVAVALLGAITHQTLAGWAPSGVPPRSFFGQFRAVPSVGFANAIIILYLVTALLGAVVYLYFKVHIHLHPRNATVIGRHIAFLELKEDFLAVGLGCPPPHIGFAGGDPATPNEAGQRRRSNRCPRVRHLVGLSRRSHHERHHGLSGRDASPFSRFAFVYGKAFGLLYLTIPWFRQ